MNSLPTFPPDGEISSIILSPRFTLELAFGDGVRYSAFCDDVTDYCINHGDVTEIYWEESHPLLWPYKEPQGDLYFYSIPEKPYEILGLLTESTVKESKGWFHNTSFLNISKSMGIDKLTSSGKGLLAKGPITLLTAFQHAIADRMRTRIYPTHHLDLGGGILFLDDNYVICKSVEVIEA